jgi:hypothetical protein
MSTSLLLARCCCPDTDHYPLYFCGSGDDSGYTIPKSIADLHPGEVLRGADGVCYTVGVTLVAENTLPGAVIWLPDCVSCCVCDEPSIPTSVVLTVTVDCGGFTSSFDLPIDKDLGQCAYGFTMPGGFAIGTFTICGTSYDVIANLNGVAAPTDPTSPCGYILAMGIDNPALSEGCSYIGVLRRTSPVGAYAVTPDSCTGAATPLTIVSAVVA